MYAYEDLQKELERFPLGNCSWVLVIAMKENRSRSNKLKINNKFKPLPKEEGEEFFPNGIFEFNITKLLAFAVANPSLFPVEEILVKQYAIWDKKLLNEATIETANLASPIVLGEISPGRFNVIDGNHRLEKARRQGLEKISAYTFRVDHHLAFLTSQRAYEAFIKYWNSKIDDLES